MVFSQISRIGQKNWGLKNKNRNCPYLSQWLVDRYEGSKVLF